MKRWNDLDPDEAMVEALDRAGARPSDSDPQNVKKNWSNAFADACARMVADALRKYKLFPKLNIYPTSEGEHAEFLTGAKGRGRGKRVDVALSSMSAGLQVGFSLKGGNFPDPGDANYGKNLTGRLYEMLDETKSIHEYHPHAVLIGIYFFPIAAATDRPNRSTFARSVAAIRAHTGRSDVLAPTTFDRFDWSVIGLYSPGTKESEPQRGVCRYFDIQTAPPVTGRPKLESTMSLRSVLEQAKALYRGGESLTIDYSDPEPA